jgi:hypothetical protein
LALVLALAADELVLRLAPGLLPGWYRERFPMHGVELFHPGILEATPIEGVPVPVLVQRLTSGAPADLKRHGLVPADWDGERRYDRVVLPVVANGFCNERVLERAEIVFVGDSFTVAMGYVEPPCLQGMIARGSGCSVYNLGVAAIGPVQEAWLLERFGLPRGPRAVVWFWFGGNDMRDVVAPHVYRLRGQETWADAYPDRRVPRLILPDLVSAFFDSAARPVQRPSQEGLVLATEDPPQKPVWFNSEYLRALTWSRELVESDRGWLAARDSLEQAREASAAAGAELLVVFLPSKSQVYLPWLDVEDEALWRMVTFDQPPDFSMTPAEFRRSALEHRGDQEAVLRAWCESQSVPFLSATPFLEELVKEGRHPFLAADTHWNEVGQEALAEPLIALLEERGLVCR